MSESDPLTLNDMEVVRAPGFESEGFSVEDVCAGINIVHGPNAIGKTTLAKSVQWLLWPDACAEYATLVGTLSLNGDEWRVELDGNRVAYQRDGQEANGPALPPADQRDRYLLSLHDLLQHDNRNETFAETIERESAGGYDLSTAYSDLGYDDSPSTRGKNIVKEAENAVQGWRDAQSKVTELRREQDRLGRLRANLEEAQDAETKVKLLDTVIEYVKAQNELQEAQNTLDTFPDVLEHVGGDEVDEVESLEDKIQEWKEKRTTAEATKAEAREELKEADLPDEGLGEGAIEEINTLQDNLKSAEEQSRSIESDLDGAKKARENARNDIPLDVDNEDLAALDPVSWKEISRFSRHAEELRAARESHAAIEDHFGDDALPDIDRSSLQRGSQALEQWLATPVPQEASTDNTAFRIALASASMLAVASIALGVLVHPTLFVTLLAAAGVLLYGYLNRESKDRDHDPRKPHRESFEQTGLAAPDDWTEDDVRARLVELYDEIARYEVAEEREQLHKTLTADEERLEEKQETVEETRETLRERLGAAPDSTDLELTVLTKRVLDWQAANDEVLQLQGELETVEDQLGSFRDQLQSKLDRYGYDDIEDASTAAKAIRNLESRNRSHESAKQKLSQATAMIAEATEKIDSLESERDTIFVDLELDTNDHDSLRSYCNQVADYEEAIEGVNRAEGNAQGKEEALEEFDEFDESLVDQSVAELERERHEAATVADQSGDLRGEIADIKAEINRAKQGNTVETAIAEKERALNKLKGQLDDDCAGMVGDVLVDHIQEITMESGRPAVFQRAQEILATITRGRYRLDFDEDAAAFRAFDTTKQKGFALDELSSGTRLQVLLAVRIAFVEQQEQSLQLPLVLDETLANSDDLRADVIIESVIELAQEGRQVFYLTAQGNEVSKWVAALEETDTVEHSVIDLADACDHDGQITVPAVSEIDTLRPEPPSPNGHDHESYGAELDIPPFNPHRGAEAAHLWYVVDDVEQLYELLNLGIERWGQLHNWLERGREDHVVDDPEQLAKIEQNAEAVDAFVQAWKVGRGKPVDRQALEDSGAVSENFIDRVADLTSSVNGDAERIIRALRNKKVKRFQSDKTDELEAYFEEHGYLEPTEPLNDEQIQLRVTERLLESGVDRRAATERTTALINRLNSTE